jgi:subtilisin-like proprotein convertase family protein
VEANGTPATANPILPSGWATGTIDPVADTDFYSLMLNAGDSVFLSLDLDPERDGVTWNGRLGFGLFGNPPSNQILVANDANVISPNSEAFFMTVKDAGIYYPYVDTPVAGMGGVTVTYHINVTVIPAAPDVGSCATYTSTDVPVAIPTGPGIVTSTLTIPGNPIIADLDVTLNITHTFMADLDFHLISPAGNNNGLLTDVGGATVSGTQTLMDLVLDDDAALPPAFAISAPMYLQPELAYRLSWFDGENAGGTWSLVLRDDATGDGGTLNSWSLRICEPPPPPACPANSTLTTLFSTDFEANDGGFTHSGTQDEWEHGLPTSSTPLTNPISSCNSGANCWKTDLDDLYNVSSTQNLLSPAIPLTTTGLVGPLYFSWAQRYHIESANFDHASVDVQLAGGGSATRLWEWLGATMNNTVGNPSVTIAESGGWGVFTQTLSNSYIGQNIEALFHLDSDNTVQLSGLAIDDVSVSGCVSTPNNPPNANAGNDQNVYVDSTVTLDGSASNDPDNNLPLTFAWAQSGGPAVTLSSASAVSPTFTAPSTPTVLTFTLTVTDSLGASGEPSTVQVTVGDVPISEPSIDHDSPTLLGNATHFTGTVDTGTNVVYSWDFGDGNFGAGQYVTHTYALVGTYPITLTISNGFGSGQVTSQVTVFDYRLYLPLILR